MNRSRALLLCVGVAVLLLAPLDAHGAGPANPYDQAIRQIRGISDSPNVRLLHSGRSSTGRMIPAFAISDFSGSPDTKARILIIAGQHGDEYNAVASVLSICKDLAWGAQSHSLARSIVIVAPMVNPDGVAASQRLNALGVDVNRDWLDLNSPETQYVNGIIRRWKPHVLIDAHEWTSTPLVPANEIEVPKCVSQVQATAMLDLAARVERSSGLTVLPCTADSDKRLFHRRYALLGYASYLIETRAGDSYATKRQSYSSAITTILDTVTNDTTARVDLSPAARNFDVLALSAYLDRLPNQNPNSASLAFSFALLLGGYFLLAWLARSAKRGDEAEWSHRFRKCAVECEVAAHPLIRRRIPQPLTTRSWANRRMRARCAPIDRLKPAPEAPKTPQRPAVELAPPRPAFGWSLMDAENAPTTNRTQPTRTWSSLP